MRDPPPGDEEVQHRVPPDVVHGLLVRDHGEVVSVALQDLVVHPQPRPLGRAPLAHLRDVDAVVRVALGAAAEVLKKETLENILFSFLCRIPYLVDSSADLEPAPLHLPPFAVQAALLRQGDGDLKKQATSTN